MPARQSPQPAPHRMLGAVCACALGLLAGAAPMVRDGVYSREQAERGRGLYERNCADCHGAQLEGGKSSPLAGPEFIRSWGRPDLTLDDLFYIVRKTMPKETPGTLMPDSCADIVAFILQKNAFPPGDKDLVPDPAVMKTVRFVSPVPPGR